MTRGFIQGTRHFHFFGSVLFAPPSLATLATETKDSTKASEECK